jgi:hypothetical protein
LLLLSVLCCVDSFLSVVAFTPDDASIGCTT